MPPTLRDLWRQNVTHDTVEQSNTCTNPHRRWPFGPELSPYCARILYIQGQSIVHHVEQYPCTRDSAVRTRHLMRMQRKMKEFENPGVSY